MGAEILNRGEMHHCLRGEWIRPCLDFAGRQMTWTSIQIGKFILNFNLTLPDAIYRLRP